jgi:hypothetical protein
MRLRQKGHNHPVHCRTGAGEDASSVRGSDTHKNSYPAQNAHVVRTLKYGVYRCVLTRAKLPT